MTEKLQGQDRDIIFETIKEVPIPIFGFAGMIETVSAVPTSVPTAFYNQFKMRVNSFTSPSAAEWYFYSNRAKKWISAKAGLVG